MLNKRLKAIASFVSKDGIVADIGTDHAFLPIELVKDKVIHKAYACDVNIGPLNIAKEHIEQTQMGDKIFPVLCNGLEGVPEDANIVVIAGMGFQTAQYILENAITKLYSFKQIIVQVNNDICELRRWISDHHFTIVNEKLVYDRRFYTIIEFNTNYHDTYSDLHILFGPILLHNRNDLFEEYTEQCLRTYQLILQSLPSKDSRYDEINRLAQIYESILNKKLD